MKGMPVRKTAELALFTALGSILFTLESLIPFPIPWMRIGLANAVTLLVLSWYGWREALTVAVLRVILGSLMAGRLFHPLFWFGLAGGLGSVAVMSLSLRIRRVGIVGVSMLGAAAKNLAQLGMAGVLFLGYAGAVTLLPFFLLSALISGFLMGVLVLWIHTRWKGPNDLSLTSF